MVFCVMILCTFTGVLCGTRGDGVRRWWSGTQGMALTGSQMRSERRLEGTRGNTKAGQKKRSETKYGCGGEGCGDYHKGGTICYILFVVMCGDGVTGAGTEHTQQDTQHTQGIALTGSQMRSERRLEVTQGNTRADT